MGLCRYKRTTGRNDPLPPHRTILSENDPRMLTPRGPQFRSTPGQASCGSRRWWWDSPQSGLSLPGAARQQVRGAAALPVQLPGGEFAAGLMMAGGVLSPGLIWDATAGPTDKSSRRSSSCLREGY